MRALAIALGVALSSGPARGDEARDNAKIHFDAGESHYASERWADAVREFAEAYRLSPLPDLLLDMARAESKLGDDLQAIHHLELYLAARPDAEDAPSVRAEIEQRKRALAAKEEARRAERAAAVVKARAEEEIRRVHARPRWPAYALFAGAGALAVGGALLGYLANKNAIVVAQGGTHAAAGAPVDFANAEGGRYATAQTTGQRDAAAGIALDVIGGAALAAAVGLIVWATRPAPERRAAIEAAPGGLQVRF